MTPKAAVWAVWRVMCLCASDWRARAVIWEVLRGRKAPVASRDAKSSKCGGVVYNFWTLTCQIWSDNSLGAHPSKGASAPAMMECSVSDVVQERDVPATLRSSHHDKLNASVNVTDMDVMMTSRKRSHGLPNPATHRRGTSRVQRTLDTHARRHR